MNVAGNIYGINGPIVTIKGNLGFKISEMVFVGKKRLVGEVIGLTKALLGSKRKCSQHVTGHGQMVRKDIFGRQNLRWQK